MATSSLAATVFSPIALTNSSSFPTKSQLSTLSLPNFRRTLSHSPQVPASSFRVLAVPEALESQETLPESFKEEDAQTSKLSIGADSDKMAPKNKIRIKLRSYWVRLIEDSCKQIIEAARITNAKTMGPVPLPTKKRVYCLLTSPHGHKDARFQFEIRTHQRLIDILYPTAQTIDALMLLNIPAGVDVEVKL